MQLSKLAFIQAAIIFCFLTSTTKSETTIRYPQADALFKQHHEYPIELLKLALSYAPEKIIVQPSEYFMTQGRAIKQLKVAKDIDIMWTMTSTEREAEINPIRIPIYKGLIGWRLFLCTKEWLSERPNNTLGLSEIKHSIIIQGHDWPDTKILTYNQFNVLSGSNYEGLFQILSLNRAELFPRSIIEIWDELETYNSSNIRLEPGLLISYPTASYFFVSYDNVLLAKLIENGLNKAHEDGSFEHLFNRYYKKIIDKSDLKNRRHFHLINPLLPDETPLNKKHYWFDLDND